jgi:hypothetical protein
LGERWRVVLAQSAVSRGLVVAALEVPQEGEGLAFGAVGVVEVDLEAGGFGGGVEEGGVGRGGPVGGVEDFLEDLGAFEELGALGLDELTKSLANGRDIAGDGEALGMGGDGVEVAPGGEEVGRRDGGALGGEAAEESHETGGVVRGKRLRIFHAGGEVGPAVGEEAAAGGGAAELDEGQRGVVEHAGLEGVGEVLDVGGPLGVPGFEGVFAAALGLDDLGAREPKVPDGRQRGFLDEAVFDVGLGLQVALVEENLGLDLFLEVGGEDDACAGEAVLEGVLAGDVFAFVGDRAAGLLAVFAGGGLLGFGTLVGGIGHVSEPFDGCRNSGNGMVRHS